MTTVRIGYTNYKGLLIQREVSDNNKPFYMLSVILDNGNYGLFATNDGTILMTLFFNNLHNLMMAQENLLSNREVFYNSSLEDVIK